MPETYRKLTEGDDPFGALPYGQMTDAIDIVAAMAKHAVIGTSGVTEDFHTCLGLLRGRVREVQQSMAWSDYRKEYGVSAGTLSEAHKAFLAGWEAALGKSFEGGPLR